MKNILISWIVIIFLFTPFEVMAGEKWGLSIGPGAGNYGHGIGYYMFYLPNGIYSQYVLNYRPVAPPIYYGYGYPYVGGNAYSTTTPFGGSQAGTQVIPPTAPNQPSVITIAPNSTVNPLPSNPNVLIVQPRRDFIDQVGRLLNIVPYIFFYDSGKR